MNNDIVGEVFLRQDQIQARVQELGQAISADFAGRDLVLVGILRGSIVFMADLMRYITIPVAVDFIAISSYGDERDTTGAVRILKDLDEPVAGKYLLVVEDIIDTGLTLGYLIRHLQTREPAGIEVCTLLDRSIRRIVPLPITYKGFDIPDVFVVGYGMDYQQLYRNLPALHYCNIKI